MDHLITSQVTPWHNLDEKMLSIWLPQSKQPPEVEIQHFHYLRQALCGSQHIYIDGSKAEEYAGAELWASTA